MKNKKNLKKLKVVRKMPYYGFDHEAVKKYFDGEPEFVNEFCVMDEYRPVAVYRAKKVNRKKGHKKYLLLQSDVKDAEKGVFVRGMSAKRMEEWRYQKGVHCLSCDEVIYSVNRHDYHHCSCGDVGVDGGRDYLSVSWEPGTIHEEVEVDLLKNQVSEIGIKFGNEDGLKKAARMAKEKK